MEILNSVWGWILSIFGGISISAIVIAIIIGFIKGFTKKIFAKINIKKVVEDATTQTIDKIKNVSIKQNIQPVLNSELQAVNEKANEYIKAEIDALNQNYIKLIKILEKLSAYFDNSFGVPEEKKKELHDTINSALETPKDTENGQEIVIEDNNTIVLPIEDKKEPTTAKKGATR